MNDGAALAGVAEVDTPNAGDDEADPKPDAAGAAALMDDPNVNAGCGTAAGFAAVVAAGVDCAPNENVEAAGAAVGGFAAGVAAAGVDCAPNVNEGAAADAAAAGADPNAGAGDVDGFPNAGELEPNVVEAGAAGFGGDAVLL